MFVARVAISFIRKSAQVSAQSEPETGRNGKPKHAGLAVHVIMNVMAQSPGYETPVLHSPLQINLRSFPHLTPLTFDLP